MGPPTAWTDTGGKRRGMSLGENSTLGSRRRIAAISLTGAEFGVLIGVRERRVRELRDKGVLASDESGRYPLANVTAYCAHIRPADGGAAEGGSDAGKALDAARIRLVTAQAEAREILNAQLRGEVVLAEDVEIIVGGTFDAVRAKLLAVPTTAAARLQGVTDQVAVRAEIAGLIENALAELAQTEVVGTVKDRARKRAGRDAADDDFDDESAVAG